MPKQGIGRGGSTAVNANMPIPGTGCGRVHIKDLIHKLVERCEGESGKGAAVVFTADDSTGLGETRDFPGVPMLVRIFR